MILFDSTDNRCFLPDIYEEGMDKDWVNVVGYQKILPGETYPKEGFPDHCLFKEHGGRYISNFQLIYIAHGTGDFQDRGIHYKVKSGHFILIQPGYWHSYTPGKETGWEEYYIGFDGPILSHVAQEIYKINNINHLKTNNSDFALPILDLMLKYGKENTEDAHTILKALLMHLMTNIRLDLKATNASAETLFFKARQYMEDNLSKKISLDDIANHLGVSNSFFRKEFQKESGIAPATFLGRVRLQTSKYLLLSSNYSIKEISVKCGFSTSDYYCKFFRDNTGMTPSEFRAQGAGQTSY